jgi:hypothetical protein
MTSEFYSRYRDPNSYHFAVNTVKGNDIGDLQRDIVQKVIRSNDRLKLGKILDFVRSTLEQE